MLAGGEPIPLARATPDPGRANVGAPRLAELGDRAGGQNLVEIPKMYHPRLEPNRSRRAQRIGASAASELAVERALDWLSRHQDEDGRWDGGIARYEDGTPVKGDNDFTAHCPPGETCFGECAYWEADTALTGLALLTFLGAGYTQTDGRYAEVVGSGLDFLVQQQKPDGDLRGRSEVVGMYCHAMATLAICEALALTGDERLRGPAERAVAYLVRGRARDGMAWRVCARRSRRRHEYPGVGRDGTQVCQGSRNRDPRRACRPSRHAAVAREGCDRRIEGIGSLPTVGTGHPDHDR